MQKLWALVVDGTTKEQFDVRDAAEKATAEVVSTRQFETAVELHEIRLIAKYEIGVVAVQKTRKRTKRAPKETKDKGAK